MFQSERCRAVDGIDELHRTIRADLRRVKLRHDRCFAGPPTAVSLYFIPANDRVTILSHGGVFIDKDRAASRVLVFNIDAVFADMMRHKLEKSWPNYIVPRMRRVGCWLYARSTLGKISQ